MTWERAHTPQAPHYRKPRKAPTHLAPKRYLLHPPPDAQSPKNARTHAAEQVPLNRRAEHTSLSTPH